MSSNTIPITKRGAELLKEELQRLKHTDRPAVINAKIGRAHVWTPVTL